MDNNDYIASDYMDHPIVGKYLRQLFRVADDLLVETDPLPFDREVKLLRDVLGTLVTRIVIKGEVDEVDTILRFHYPDADDPDQKNSLDILTEYPLSTSN